MASSVVIIFLGCLACVLAYKTGAPTSVCDSMLPDHGVDALTTDIPYSLKVEPTKVAPGGKATITLEGIKGKKFRGFMIEGRLGNTIVGTFDASGLAQTIDCPKGTKNAATHTSEVEKPSIKISWNAPKDLKEEVTFYVTVVERGDKYWVKKPLGKIRVE